MDTRNTTAQPNLLSRTRTALSVAAVLVISATVASAHPGHALDAEPVSHLMASPYHLITLTMMGAGLLLGALFVKRLAARRMMQVTGVAALGVAAITVATQLLH